MSTFFDANVLLEILIAQRPGKTAAIAALGEAKKAFISPLSVHLYVYFGKKEGYPVTQLSEEVLAYQITDMGPAVVQWAISHCKDDDFEDALQVGCAVMEGCNKFVTFDSKLAKRYSSYIDIQLLTS